MIARHIEIHCTLEIHKPFLHSQSTEPLTIHWCLGAVQAAADLKVHSIDIVPAAFSLNGLRPRHLYPHFGHGGHDCYQDLDEPTQPTTVNL